MANGSFGSIAHLLREQFGQSFTVEEVMKNIPYRATYHIVQRELNSLAEQGFVKYFVYNHCRYYSWR